MTVGMAATRWLRRVWLWMLWVLACAVGAGLATATATVWAPGALASGALIGAAQWLALRGRGRVTPWWIAATAVSLPLGGWLFFTLGTGASTVLEQAMPAVREVAGGDTLVPFLLLPLSVGMLAGAILGIAQAFSQRDMTRMLGWSLWNAAAGALVLPLAFLAAFAVAEASRYAASEGNHLPGNLGPIIVGAITGAAYSVIASGGLRSLLRPTHVIDVGHVAVGEAGEPVTHEAGVGALGRRTHRIRIGSWHPTVGDLVVAGLALAMLAAAWQVVRPKHLPSDVRVVYLPDRDRPRLSSTDMQAAGVVVVQDVESLLMVAETADVIMLDRGRLRELPPGWLLEQSNQGRVIVGTNVSGDELEQYTNRSPPRPPAGGWHEEPSTFTAHWHLAVGQRSSAGVGLTSYRPVGSGSQVALYVADLVHQIRSDLGHGPFVCRSANDCGPYE